MTARHTISFSRRGMRPSHASCLPSMKTEGAGNAGCTLHPRSRVPFALKKKRTRAYRFSGGSPASPARMVLTVSFVLSPGTGLSCPRHPRDAKITFEFSASVGAPGPHDFAVRAGAARRVQRKHVHRSPAPRFVTIAMRPSGRGGIRRTYTDFQFCKSEIFF